jgi:hypothetical protein
MKRTIASLTLTIVMAFSLVCSASAAFIPDDVTYRELNGQQQAVKIFTLLPSDDPAQLREQDFEHEGYLYSFSDMVKEEKTFSQQAQHTETVTVNTDSKDLAKVLEALQPSIEYEKDGYKGTLYLDHNSIKTEASGYATRNYSVTATKNYTGLDRNDTSYIDKTVVKDGRTLSLVNVAWSVESTELVDDTLVPATYSAVASYAGTASSTVATGYVSTAEYSGTITSSGISSIIYTVTYTGAPIVVPEENTHHGFAVPQVAVAAIIAAAVLTALLLFFMLNRKNTTVYEAVENDGEFEKRGRLRLSVSKPELQLDRFEIQPEGNLAIEIDERTAQRLFGKTIVIRCLGTDYSHTVGTVTGQYWFRVRLEAAANPETEHEQEEQPT